MHTSVDGTLLVYVIVGDKSLVVTMFTKMLMCCRHTERWDLSKCNLASAVAYKTSRAGWAAKQVSTRLSSSLSKCG